MQIAKKYIFSNKQLFSVLIFSFLFLYCGALVHNNHVRADIVITGRGGTFVKKMTKDPHLKYNIYLGITPLC